MNNKAENNPAKALSNFELEEFLSGDHLNIKNIALPIEEIETYQFDLERIFGNRYFTVIFLTNPNSQIGHFTLLSHISDTELEFFDPLANPVPPLINQLCQVNQMRLITNQIAVQSKKSFVCGKWVLSRILSIPTPLQDFINIYTQRKKFSPDEMVDRLFIFKSDIE